MQQSTLTARDLSEVAPFIDGRSIPSESDHRLAINDPASGKKLLDIPAGCPQDVDNCVRSARASFVAGKWRDTPPSSKKSVLHKWADLIQANAPRLNALDALEMGKPVGLPVFDAAGAAAFVRFNAEAIDKCFGNVFTSDTTSTVIQKRFPRGIVAAIVPWNFPSYNVVLKVAPALAAGNSVVLKPSELAGQSALMLAKLALEAGLPAGIFNVAPGKGEIVGKALGEHMDIDMVTFTGSSAVGKLMLQYSGRSNMKVVSAECGGKSPQIVFDDGVDLDRVADSVAAMILLNQGQVCSAGSRVLVQDTIEERLVEKLVSRFEKIASGDPQLPTTSYGPLVSNDQLKKVLAYIGTGSAEGAELIYGGSRMLEETGGYFIKPTLFTRVPESSTIAQEEIFGPVLSVMRFHDVRDAVRLANSTCYGLAAYIWTSRMDTGFKLASAVHAAVTMINAQPPAGEGPGFAFSAEPFGLSGIGHEGGLPGLETYTRRQTMWFNHGA